MASYNPPLSSTTSSPVSRSAATAAKGTGIRSICTSGTNSFIASITRSPLTSPSVLNAKSTRLKTLYLSSARIHSLNGSRYPEAYTPPTSAPIEVPATALISNPASPTLRWPRYGPRPVRRRLPAPAPLFSFSYIPSINADPDLVPRMGPEKTTWHASCRTSRANATSARRTPAPRRRPTDAPKGSNNARKTLRPPRRFSRTAASRRR